MPMHINSDGVEQKNKEEAFKQLEWKGSPKDMACARSIEFTVRRGSRVTNDGVAEI